MPIYSVAKGKEDQCYRGVEGRIGGCAWSVQRVDCSGAEGFTLGKQFEVDRQQSGFIGMPNCGGSARFNNTIKIIY